MRLVSLEAPHLRGHGSASDTGEMDMRLEDSIYIAVYVCICFPIRPCYP